MAVQYLQPVAKSASQSLITSFINEHPLLLNVLLEAPFQVGSVFDDATLSLELHQDPEENYSILFLLIHTSVEKSDEKLRLLFKNWQSLKNQAVNKYLSINAELL